MILALLLAIPMTQGAINPNVTQASIHSTICVSGWTRTVRPSYSYTEPIKVRQIAQYKYVNKNVSNYEEDHIIPLELGGAPKDVRNLWPEPHPQAYVSDGMENRLRSEVCLGQITLAQGRVAIVKYKFTHG